MQKAFNTLLIFSILSFYTISKAQQQTRLDQALRFVESQNINWNLSKSDLKNLAVSDMYISSHNGVSHIYLQQQYKDIPIYNAVTSVHISKEGKIYDSPSRFISDIENKINATKPKISSSEALIQIVKDLNIENALVATTSSRTIQNSVIPKTNFTLSDVPVKLTYQPTEDGKLKLAYDLRLEMKMNSDHWSYRVDAQTGEILDKQNLTIYCKINHKIGNRVLSSQSPIPVSEVQNVLRPSAPNSYNVIAFPTESPIHGPRTLVVDPAFPNASPFGWHDTNGQAGPEYLVTRGNNVNAYLDKNSNNANDGTQPNGGSSLIFDFPFNQNLEPSTYQAAAQTNLFYVCNMMHDVLYQFGFDEASGNFQFNNYGKGGNGSDPVLGEAQDGSGVNNANFSTPADGASPRMQMYLWTATQTEVSVTLPDSIAGFIDAIRGSFGPEAPDTTMTPIEGEAVWSDDGSGIPTFGCKDSQKKSLLQGKIVFIERGNCDFSAKCFYAQKAGAVAAIICGFDDTRVGMGAGANAASVNIPSYYLSKSSWEELAPFIGKGLKLKIQKPKGTKIGADSLDGDFDNGIIAHEYGHGVSNRLTGGPSLSGCLNNAENMGEGWSDFMSLIIQAKVGDKGTDIKGIGNYANNDKPTGLGIRRKPYTTDFERNNFTYVNKGTETHDIGEVWNVMLWDLYWGLVEQHGFDPDLKNKNSGNNICIQLVMDGMKLQPCVPGFVDGRNAILKADSINYGGANSCIIWKAFAKRGLGFAAKQGSSNFNGDETEDFEPFPLCLNTILVSKKAQQLVKAGEEILYTLSIKNYKTQTIENLVIEENIPAGCTYVSNSASIVPTSVTSNTIIWTIPSMLSLDKLELTYRFSTSPSFYSNTLWFDDMEAPDIEDKWLFDVDPDKNNAFWVVDNQHGYKGSNAWAINDVPAEVDANLFYYEPITLNGKNPALFFQHSYNTPKTLDGGFIEVSEDNISWKRLNESDFLLNGYTGGIDYQTIAIPFLKGFSGNSGDFIPTVLDLSSYDGKSFWLRFRFASETTAVNSGPLFAGWVIDNVEYITPFFYNSETCVTTKGGDHICVTAPGKGTLIDSKKLVKTNDLGFSSVTMNVYPNPSSEILNISLSNASQITEINISNTTGQKLKTFKLLESENQNFSIPIHDLVRGMFIVEAIGANISINKKVIIK